MVVVRQLLHPTSSGDSTPTPPPVISGGSTPIPPLVIDGGNTPTPAPIVDGGSTLTVTPIVDGGNTFTVAPIVDGGSTFTVTPIVDGGSAIASPTPTMYTSGANSPSLSTTPNMEFSSGNSLEGNQVVVNPATLAQAACSQDSTNS